MIMGADINSKCRSGTLAMLVFAIVHSAGLPGQAADALEVSKACGDNGVRSIRVTTDVIGKVRLDAPGADIELQDQVGFQDKSGAKEKAVAVIARGPALGSMDSNRIETDFACTPAGVVMTAIITRSSSYQGATAKNVLWNPGIRIELIPHRPEMAIQTIWKMRLADGKLLDRARTPPYPEIEYPIVLAKTLRF